jgi:hypothetical protein
MSRLGGRASFYLNLGTNSSQPAQIELPTLALWKDDTDGSGRLVVVIQAEDTGNECIVGFRFFEGGNGVCVEDLEQFSAKGPRPALS